MFTLLAALLACVPVHAAKSPYDWALVRLDYARQGKVEQLGRFCERMHALARKAAGDEAVNAFFNMNRHHAAAKRQGPVPEALTAKVGKFRQQFDRYYVENYFAFYDLLFVDRQGNVFYTIRKESDINDNLMDGALAGTPLGTCIAAKPDHEVFVDFHDYGPSSEAAAFFVEPMREEGEHAGWLVLQCAINRVNSLFTATEDLGQTGETFLVNEEGYMLTESFFVGGPTILDQHLDDRNIQAKFKEGRGHRTVTDYRGATALTSFEVFEFMETRWLVVAKLDKAEVTTSHYANHAQYYADRLLHYLEEHTPAPSREVSSLGDGAMVRVDMDEFLKARDGQRIETFGVSACTAFLATYPGHFAYLAHITPKDRLYGGKDTDLLGQMDKKIENFDIYPSERRHVMFVVVAPHLTSLAAIVNRLVEEGFLLSQIRVLYNPEARTAAMVYDYVDNALRVTWICGQDQGTECVHCLDAAVNIGEIVQGFVAAQDAGG